MYAKYELLDLIFLLSKRLFLYTLPLSQADKLEFAPFHILWQSWNSVLNVRTRVWKEASWLCLQIWEIGQRNAFVSSTLAAVMVSSHSAFSRNMHYFVKFVKFVKFTGKSMLQICPNAIPIWKAQSATNSLSLLQSEIIAAMMGVPILIKSCRCNPIVERHFFCAWVRRCSLEILWRPLFKSLTWTCQFTFFQLKLHYDSPSLPVLKLSYFPTAEASTLTA